MQTLEGNAMAINVGGNIMGFGLGKDAAMDVIILQNLIIKFKQLIME